MVKPVYKTKPSTNGHAIRANRDRRVRRDSRGGPPPLPAVEKFLSDYIVLPKQEMLVTSLWTIAAWIADVWDRFAHVAVTSPEKRCGKTRLLQLLALLTPNARHTSNISPAAVYRWIEQTKPKPTLLLDEAQSIQRRFSESSELLRELLNAGIDKNAKVVRMGGERYDEVKEFSAYCPKAVALIGDLDGVLADRCLPIRMTRKTDADAVLPYRSRLVDTRSVKLKMRIKRWAMVNKKAIADVFDHLGVFPLQNDRLAELLLPLQAVLTVADKSRLPELQEYAAAIDTKDVETETPGIRLLTACRELFTLPKGKDNDCDKYRKNSIDEEGFIPTSSLISYLATRREEPWRRWNHGHLITPEALANLLRPFGIRSTRNRDQSARGFYEDSFGDAWARYLPPATPQKKPPNPSISSSRL